MSVIFAGCKKHECAELSWTEYNSVEDVWCNFRYNNYDLRQYVGDTLKVYGLLFKRTESYRECQHLTNDKDVQFSNNMSRLCTNPHVRLHLCSCYDSIMPSDPYDSFVYVTGTVQYDPEIIELYISTNQIIKTPNYED